VRGVLEVCAYRKSISCEEFEGGWVGSAYRKSILYEEFGDELVESVCYLSSPVV
jgi:hypothetical protein